MGAAPRASAGRGHAFARAMHRELPRLGVSPAHVLKSWEETAFLAAGQPALTRGQVAESRNPDSLGPTAGQSHAQRRGRGQTL